jgi:hypothetical protein
MRVCGTRHLTPNYIKSVSLADVVQQIWDESSLFRDKEDQNGEFSENENVSRLGLDVTLNTQHAFPR